MKNNTTDIVMIIITCVFIVCSIMWFHNADARSMKCGSSWIQEGDSVSDVYSKCGRPDFDYETSGSGAYKRQESWSYDRDRTTDTLIIRDGRVIDIDGQLNGNRSRRSGLTGISY